MPANATTERWRFGKAVEEHFGIPSSSLLIRDGKPFKELARVAEEVHADAVVVGAAEHRIGSLAVPLVKGARWPVTVVPSPRSPLPPGRGPY